MTRCYILACAAAAAACWGCHLRPTGKPTATPIQGKWAPARTTRTQVQMTPLGQVPNSGLQLPVVSPDGQWIAYLQLRGDQPVALEAVFTGKGLEAMALYVRKVGPGAQPSLLCPTGAAWPAWSPDSRRLAFVAYNKDGRCELGVHDVGTGATRRIGTGLKRMMMPAISPSGRQAAVVAGGRGAGGPRLYVLTLKTGKLQSCPARSPSERQLWPQWTADGRVVYVLGQGDRTWLARWGPPGRASARSGAAAPGESAPERLCEIHMPESGIGSYQTFAGLGRPLSPDGRRFAYYDTARDRITLVNLADGARTGLPHGTRAGCWLGPKQYVAATDKEMLLIAGAGQATPREPHVVADSPVRLMRGPWLPRGSVDRTNQLILCTRGSHRGAFRLVRMKVLSYGPNIQAKPKSRGSKRFAEVMGDPVRPALKPGGTVESHP